VRKLIKVAALAIATIATLTLGSSASTGLQHLLIHVRLSKEVHPRTSGRLLVLLSKGTGKDRLAFGMVPVDTWVAAREVSALMPGEDGVDIDADDLAFPSGFSRVPPGDYQIQAFLDVNHSYAYGGVRPGDLFSKPHTLTGWRPDASESIVLSLDQEVARTEPALSLSIQPIKFQSPALTAFWGRPIDITGYVILPPSYSMSTRTTYPTVYWTHGFGGTLTAIARGAEQRAKLMASKDLPEMIWVFLNESFPTGTVEFADSVNNGPWGFALTRELIPDLERRYRMDGKPNGRFLTGHSSGGWATLWLQVSYPAIFGGTWSTAPDPSDFRSFTGPDIYAPHANVYRKADGSSWMLVRVDGRDVVSLENYAKLEAVLGDYGGQFASFEWVFSPKGIDGRPMPLFDRATGDVYPDVAEYWGSHYDIARKITREWHRIGKDLRGKIHVIVGGADTFHLDEPARFLEGELRRLDAGATFTSVPGKTHFDLYSDGSDGQALTKKIAREMYAIARPQR
jgi:S-formylglutathione hydrolase FrmB